MAIRYTPDKDDALYNDFAGASFDDPGDVALVHSPGFVSSLHFLKPIQDEVLNLIYLLNAGLASTTIRNTTGGTLTKGTLLYVTGYNTANSAFTVAKADATSDPTKLAMLVLTEDLADATNGVGYAYADVENIDTSASAGVGSKVYLSTTAGARIYDTAPTGAAVNQQFVGIVLTKHATTGSIRFFPGAMRLEKIGTNFLQDLMLTAAKIAADAVTTAKILDANVTAAKLDTSAVDNQICDGRLTIDGSQPVTTNETTSSTSVVFAPYKGNRVALYDGTSRWKLHSFTSLVIALGTLTSGKNYDVFIYDNAGSIASELVVWTNDTTRATALTLQDGVLVKTGATTRRYVGTFRTISTTETCDTVLKRFVWSYYHRVRRHLSVVDSTDSWTYGTASYRQVRAQTANRVEYVCGFSEDAVQAETIAAIIFLSGGASSNAGGTGIGIDSTTVNSAQQRWGYAQTGFFMTGVSKYRGYPGVGYHALNWLEAGGNNGVTDVTFAGDNGASATTTALQAGLSAEVMG